MAYLTESDLDEMGVEDVKQRYDRGDFTEDLDTHYLVTKWLGTKERSGFATAAWVVTILAVFALLVLVSS